MSEGKTAEGTPKGRLPGMKRCTRSRALLEQPLLPRNAGRSIRSVRPLLGTPAAGDRSMDGTGWSAGQFWKSRLFRGCCWERILRDHATLQEMEQKTLQHLWFTS